MKSIDVPLPAESFDALKRFPKFNLIYPYEHPVAQHTLIDMSVRIMGFDDDDFREILSGKHMKEFTPLGSKLYEIDYLRDCAFHRVVNTEWKNCYGPIKGTFFKVYELENIDSPVRILSLFQPQLSLKVFNYKYGKARSDS